MTDSCGNDSCLWAPPRSFGRRELLRFGGTGLMGLSLSRLLAAEKSLPRGGTPARADSLIVILLNGGPSHLDMWDMKPDGPADSRGEFRPVATTVPGVAYCEHLPRLARLAHRTTLVRSMNHGVNQAHALAVYTALTGHDRGDTKSIVGNSLEDYPCPGAVTTMVRPAPRDAIGHVTLPYKTKEGATGPPQPGFFGGWLGPAFDPLWVLKDPNASDFAVGELTLQSDLSAERLAARGQLLAQLAGRLHDDRSARARLESMDGLRRRAMQVLTSPSVQRAFRIGDEPDHVRDSYGRNIYGQSVLLARRLIEAGTRVVTVSWAPDANATWDTHSGNFKKLKETLLPQFDAAAGTLIRELAERGLLERTIVAVLGDFGRTPKINNSEGGRDHWNWCYSVLLAGGGLRPGFVRGASDRTGAFPAHEPTSPGDLIATLYHLLGIDPHGELTDLFGRPHRIIPQGEVLRDLIA